MTITKEIIYSQIKRFTFSIFLKITTATKYMGITNQSLASKNFNETIGNSLVIAVISNQNNCKIIIIVIGCFSILKSYFLLYMMDRRNTNKIPRSKGSVGIEKLAPKVSPPITNDSGVRKTVSIRIFSKEIKYKRVVNNKKGRA